jgi:P4 family phage/plasmid primase-like protien
MQAQNQMMEDDGGDWESAAATALEHEHDFTVTAPRAQDSKLTQFLKDGGKRIINSRQNTDKQPNHVFMDGGETARTFGGRINVELEDLPALREAIAADINRDVYHCLVERFPPIANFAIDWDLKTEQPLDNESKLAFTKTAQAAVRQFLPRDDDELYRSIVCAVDGPLRKAGDLIKDGLHQIFPHLHVTHPQAKHLITKVVLPAMQLEHPEIDWAKVLDASIYHEGKGLRPLYAVKRESCRPCVDKRKKKQPVTDDCPDCGGSFVKEGTDHTYIPFAVLNADGSECTDMLEELEQDTVGALTVTSVIPHEVQTETSFEFEHEDNTRKRPAESSGRAHNKRQHSAPSADTALTTEQVIDLYKSAGGQHDLEEMTTGGWREVSPGHDQRICLCRECAGVQHSDNALLMQTKHGLLYTCMSTKNSLYLKKIITDARLMLGGDVGMAMLVARRNEGMLYNVSDGDNGQSEYYIYDDLSCLWLKSAASKVKKLIYSTLVAVVQETRATAKRLDAPYLKQMEEASANKEKARAAEQAAKTATKLAVANASTRADKAAARTAGAAAEEACSAALQAAIDAEEKLQDDANEVYPDGVEKLMHRLHAKKENLQTHIEKHSTLAAVLQLLDHEVRDTDFGKTLDQQIDTLPVTGGMIDLRKKELRPRVKEDLCTFALKHTYNPEHPKLPTIIKIMTEITLAERLKRHEYLEFMQRRLGYNITGETSLEDFMLWIGDGSNGKSFLKDLLTAVLGPLHAVGSNQLMEQAPAASAGGATPHLMATKGKRAITIEELKRTLDEDNIKRFSGGGEMSGRKNYGDEENFTMRAKFLGISNHMPEVTSVDPAILRRLTIFHFGASFLYEDDPKPELRYDASNPTHFIRDNTYKSQIPELTEAFLAWLVEGAFKFYTEGIGPIPECCQVMQRKFVEDNDDVQQWIEQACTVSDKAKVSCVAALLAYNQHAEPAKRLKKSEFSKNMQQKGFAKLKDQSPRSQFQNQWVYVGISLEQSQFNVSEQTKES